MTSFSVRLKDKPSEEITMESPATALEALTAYDWPGNVRELKNVIERAVITSPGPDLRLPEDLGAGSRHRPSDEEQTPPFAPLAAVERRYITRVLEATGWRLSGPAGAAAVLELNPSTLRYRIKKLHIQKPWRKGPGNSQSHPNVH